MSHFSAVGSAFSGLLAAQAGMQASSQNVAGSSMPGFSRRRSEYIVSQMAPDARNFSSSAFTVDGFARDYSRLVDIQRQHQQGIVARNSTVVNATSTLDVMLQDPATSLGAALDNFFNAAGALVRDPTSPALKAAFTGTLQQAVNRFRSTSDAIEAVQSRSQEGIRQSIAEVNDAAKQLALVNKAIFSSQAYSMPSADLLDRRDSLLMTISEKVGGQILIGEDGMANVYLEGQPLVEGVLTNALNVSFSTNSDLTSDVKVALSSGAGDTATSRWLDHSALPLGEVGGYLALLKEDGFVRRFRNDLDTMAKSFVDSMATARDADGAPLSALLEFRSGNQVITDPGSPLRRASTMKVAESALTNFSVDAVGAQQIEGLRTGQGVSWAQIVGKTGSTIAEFQADLSSANTVMLQLDAERERISGINLDEEAANLMRYQQLYSASSQIFQTTAKMFDELLAAIR